MILFSREYNIYSLIDTKNDKRLDLTLYEARAACRYLMLELNIIDAYYLDDRNNLKNVFEMDRIIKDLYHFKYKKPWGKIMRYTFGRDHNTYFILDRQQGERISIDAKVYAELEAKYPSKEFAQLPKDEKKSEKSEKTVKSEK